MSKEMCRNCKFYSLEQERRHWIISDEELHKDDFEAICRRYPPTRGDKDFYGEMKEVTILCDFFDGPTVNALYWCGEWKCRVGLPSCAQGSM